MTLNGLSCRSIYLIPTLFSKLRSFANRFSFMSISTIVYLLKFILYYLLSIGDLVFGLDRLGKIEKIMLEKDKRK